MSDGALRFGKDGGEPLDACASSGGQPVRFGARRDGAAPTSQYAAQKKPKSHIIVLCAQLAVYLAAGFLAGWRTGAALCGCLAGYALALRKAFRSLDGMNGDISGYALTLSELCGAAVWALI